jgi:hypothetical protein
MLVALPVLIRGSASEVAPMLRVKRNEVSFETVNVGPNGNWLYQGRPFTGVAYTLGPDGTVASEQEFREGLRWGFAWERYRSGQIYSETMFYRDVLHGRAKEWHKHGQLAEEGEYEYGITIWKKKWDEDGALVEEYELAEADSNFSLLQTLRRVYDEGQKAEPPAARGRPRD